jgi:hypothetical protein
MLTIERFGGGHAATTLSSLRRSECTQYELLLEMLIANVTVSSAGRMQGELESEVQMRSK